ncbi:putative Esterase/lipase/thioesterase family lipase [Cupriavidus taiwanensis]|nr:putative Esterase/lipase/thioesterase family lipase [Cupriavidus taiwanensis]SOY97081.1 putative Esterase/lipase/thioesterase family lipase [Cupriavidus taiwanensis]
MGCVGSRPYQTELGPRPSDGGRLPPAKPVEVKKVCSSPSACVVFVEYDDYGNLMNRAQMLGAVAAAEETARAHGTVLVYVHGWHNDAANGTRDVERFKELVQRASEVDQTYRPGHEGRGNILGVYVGWRGDSIASDGLTKPFSYLFTFWDRKSAAHEIGNSGGVYDLFSRLSELRRKYGHSKLLIHGHSFGGAVVYSTVSQTLMDQIRMDASTSTSPASALADLVLIVNPAFEAMKLRPQFDLARHQEYRPDLPPRLVVITTEADLATSVTFPVGRAIGTLFESYADPQSSAENTTALGHHIPYVTHQLAKPQDTACSDATSPGGIPKSLSASAGLAALAGVRNLGSLIDQNKPTLCVPALKEFPDAARLLLQRCDTPGACSLVAGNHYIVRGAAAEGYVPFRLPIMNIRTTADVSGGHTDIRNPTLENFVVQLWALAVRDAAAVPIAPLGSEPQ